MAYTWNESPDVLFHPFVVVTTDLAEALPASSTVDTESELVTLYDTGTMTTGWQLLGKFEKPVTVNFENQTIETSDGDTIITAEQVNFSSNDLNFTADNYSYLRENLHKNKAKIMLIDPNRQNSSGKVEVIVLNNMPMIVTPVVDEMAKMLITSTKQASNADDVFSLTALA